MLRSLFIIGFLLSLGIVGLSACSATTPAPSVQETVPPTEADVAEEPTTAPVAATETMAPEEAAREEPSAVPMTTDEAAELPPEGQEAAVENTTSQPEALVTPKLNLNEAAGEEFQAAIPNFGERMVREFLEYRPYVSIQQFRQEIGKYVDEAQVAAYEQYVYVPVNVNEADAETLQQIPGVDETIAAELMAARPYESNEAFLAKLAEYVPEAELAVAGSYLVSQ